MSLLVISREEVRQHLTQARCIPIVREAMVRLSRGETRQLPRSIIDLDAGRAFGQMPGAMGGDGTFGAKLISVYPENFEMGLQSHQGGVLLFDPASGAPVALVHAGEITAIRTAAASAVATDALARRDARRLTIMGYGEQARSHAEAIAQVRPLERIIIWGRRIERARALANDLQESLGVTAHAVAEARDAVADADIICAVTASSEPVLLGEWVRPGTHVNLVGSSRAGPVEADHALVLASRFFADHRAGVLLQGAEYLRARDAGLIDETHVLGEIGAVIDGALPGRTADVEITIYKSLGSIVQDLASGWALYQDALAMGFGTRAAF
jgi:ornithine cyclodeaminase/alanine dehydrogenase-like protein (mu-crystallin family)